MSGGERRLAVVIPTLDEAGTLPLLLDDLRALRLPTEVVVVDGGSTDGTPGVARKAGARVVQGPRGRASQLQRGADGSTAPWLLFLHADTRMGPAAREALEWWLPRASPETAAVFRFRLQGDDWYWRFIEFGQRLRQRLHGLAYGDQGLVVSRRAFEAVGGYPEIPIMEDVELVRRLRSRGRVETLPAALDSSPRRYESEGKLFGWLRNTALISLYLAGVPAGRLARWYPPRRSPGGGGARTLVVFAKAPRPGRVKTRLAATVGEEAAARIYRRMGREIVERVADGADRTVIRYDPPDAEGEVRDWLGGAAPDADFRPQASGDLGSRLHLAFRATFEGGGGPVCIVGTDVPGLDAGVVRRAFAALEGDDVVLGPAEDGGYYLVGLNGPAPELFRGIPWSTDRVLEATRRRAREAGLSVAELGTLVDVDTAADLEALSGGGAGAERGAAS